MLSWDSVCRGSAIRGKEADTDLLLLNGGFGRLFDIGPDLGDVGGVAGGGDGDGLHEELVSAARVRWGVFFHGLQEDLHFDGAGGFDAAGVGADAVSERVLVCCRGGCVVGGRGGRVTYCFGAVVFTLKARGSLLGLCRRRTCETSCVKGPVPSLAHSIST